MNRLAIDDQRLQIFSHQGKRKCHPDQREACPTESFRRESPGEYPALTAKYNNRAVKQISNLVSLGLNPEAEVTIYQHNNVTIEPLSH